jgi:hypothetical protein
MAAPTMRRLVSLLLATLGLFVLPVPQVAAQESGTVRLTLLSQTPWNSTWDDTNQRELLIRFRAENLSASPIGDLSIGITLYARLITRTAYESSLSTDPPIALHTQTFTREDAIAPLGSRDFEVAFPLESPGIDPDQSGVYPLKIDLRSAFTSVAALRTPVVFLVREPEEPLRLSWTVVLHHPIAFGPDDVFTSTELETSLAPGGELASQIQALLGVVTLTPAPALDLAISPLLLLQLQRMAAGYRVAEGDGVRAVAAGEGASALAQTALDRLRTIAQSTTVRVSALPFSASELPSLVAGGLARDLGVQLERGRAVVTDALGVTPSASVLRPPGAALDDETLRELEGTGVATLVIGPSTVETEPHPLGFAGPATAALGDGTLRAIVPDPSVASFMQSGLPTLDPARTAQAILGELASIWQEQPSEVRGIALVLSEDLSAPPAFFSALVRGVAGAPWLQPMHASEFVAAFAPADPSPLIAPVSRRFGSLYIEELRRARRQVDTYRSMLVEPSLEPSRLDTLLLLAESREYLSRPDDGMAFITAVRGAVTDVFQAVTVEAVDEITLTSRTGAGVPVTVTNSAEEALRVSVLLRSSHLVSTTSYDLELPPGASQDVTFRVDPRSTGRFQIELSVVAPGGRRLGEPLEITVRSTAYNQIALIITIAAAVMLLALWVRRFLRRSPKHAA